MLTIKNQRPGPEVPPNFQLKDVDIISPVFIPPYRFIFENTVYSEAEQNFISEFKKTDVFPTLDPGYWTDANILRFIQGSGYDLHAAKANIIAHQEWRRENIYALEARFIEIEEYLVC